MLAIKNISKSYAGVRSLRDVNLEVRAGEIHAILGENGAGKSTLMKIIAGAVTRDAGTILIDGEEVALKTPQEAREKGVGIIYQEFSLVPALSVAENIFLAHLKDKTIINWRELNVRAGEIIQSLHFDIDVTLPVAKLSVAQQQVVEIAKALTGNVKLLILDEPSAVLGPADIHRLFESLRRLRDNGTAIIYISHHIEELFELCDRITILKDGATVNTFVAAETDRAALVFAMLGRSLKALFPARKKPDVLYGNKVFNAANIKLSEGKPPLSLHVSEGEILGIGGLVGSGRTEFLRAIFGADVYPDKQISVNGKSVQIHSPRTALLQGIGMVPEDRKQHGGLLNLSIRDNVNLTGYHKIKKGGGFLRPRDEASMSDRLLKQLAVKLANDSNPLSSLSGGNQQKVILAKWLNIDADILLIDEPTRGVDIGARAEIYKIIDELSQNGMAIIMVSSDWEELMGMADRIIVMRSAQIQGELQRKEFSEEKLLQMAIGITPAKA